MESGHDGAGRPPQPVESGPSSQPESLTPQQSQQLAEDPAAAVDTADYAIDTPSQAPAPTTSDSASASASTTSATLHHEPPIADATASAHEEVDHRQQDSGLSSSSKNNSNHKNNNKADPSDRVFPIRSAIRVDESQPTPWMHSREHGGGDYFPRSDSTWDGRRRPSTPRIVSDASNPPRRAATLSPSSPRDRVPLGGSRRSRKNTNTSSSSYAGPPLAPATLPLFNDGDSIPDDKSVRTSLGGTRSGTDGGGSQLGDSRSSTPSELNEGLMTTRFRHVMTDDGHAMITGCDGTLQRCEDEPIHTPGAVQGFGLLVALREEADGRFPVRIVSENSKKIIGYSPGDLFKLGSFTDILSDEQTDNLLDHIDFIRDEESDPVSSGPDVFSISLRPPTSRTIKLWCAMHVNPNHPDLIICEFELEDDKQHPVRPREESIPEEPEDTLYQSPTPEEFSQSTEISSKPLRVLRSARQRRGEAGAMQVFDIMSQVQEQFATAPNLERFLKILVGIVKELAGFHRVMVYQFDAAFNGKVVTELVDPAKTRDLYHGLHFPASDIPRQARDLYKLNKVRLLYDRDLESARLVCRTVEDLEQPLDLSHAYLRAMSPIHLKYLTNMAVRSSMSISIDAFGELWGLIACHSYGPTGMRVSFPIRKMCRMVGDTASRNIERLSYASRLHARKLINTMPTDKNPSGYIIASSEDLLKLFDADFGMLSIGEETKVLGKIAQSQEALAMLEYLRFRSFNSVLTTQDITQDFPDLRYTPGFSVVAGLLYVPLSSGGQDFIVFFRLGQIREVKWAGNPYEKTVKAGTAGFLEPRSSFKAWRETVIGKCREWTEDQIETAAVLCLVYGKFIEVWRQKEAALQSSRLTRLLLANSAHEVRTPLNAIINYLEIALEGSLDQETRENLAKSHSASRSLIYVINDLLDLTKTEEGQELVKDEIMDLPACISEATEPFKVDAKRKDISYEVIQHPGLPKFVHGDYRRVRQAVANVTANAVQNTTSGSVKVECFVVEVLESRVRVEIAVHDTGCGMSNEQLDNIFQDLEQVSSADLSESGAIDAPLDQTRESRMLGLGLAVVARVVRNMDGQLRLKSEEGKGSRFVIQVPFELPSSDALETLSESDPAAKISSDSATTPSVTKSLPPTQTGEVMLIDGGSLHAAHSPDQSISKARSFDETNSVHSLRSAHSLKSAGSVGTRSNKSDADRLIDAIQTPLSMGEVTDDAGDIQRKNSKGRRDFSSSSTISISNSNSQGPVTQTGNDGDSVHQSSLTEGPVEVAEARPGVFPVLGSKTPVKPVRIPDDYFDQPTRPQTSQNSRVLFEISEDPVQRTDTTKTETTPNSKPDKFRVLIAEDDPVNMKILTKRLEKAGHTVYPAVNGEDCATVFKERPSEFDIVLMDMQMPIVDGLTSTKLIRAFEQSNDCRGLSALGRLHGHIPIFAVSASLVERDRAIYTTAGFDGWILKPIDFKRLNVLLEGVTSDEVREGCLYQPGEWERGGWFVRRATDMSET
ncbi:hsp90-like protein [Xylaria bambusicola]|uniref:hsp90-like protein n=1 Tax=Xylaria bambusicola TaxID=326684 RepID=UPI00200876B6|nr:hsp90-like protein [Xylaria bambusicola]KAI0509673.1 hsp90-like protein [Xylaria bambusicola]